MAFAREVRARLPPGPANAGFNLTTRQSDSSTYGPITCSPPKATSSWRFDGRISPSAGHQLRGCLVTTPTGLPPASPPQLSGHTPPQLTDRPSLHAISSTPERFRADPESMARTPAFASLTQARPARPLTGLCFDAAEFTFVTACSFASPRFNGRISPDDGGWLPGSSGGFPGAGLAPA